MPNGDNQDLSFINSFFGAFQPKEQEPRVPGSRSEGGRRRLEERFGPFRASTLARSNLAKSTLLAGSDTKSLFSGALSQAAGPPSPLRDVLGDLTRDRATRENLIGNLVLTSGIASAFGVGGGQARRAISRLSKSSRPTLEDALQLAASQGKTSNIFATLVGARLDPFPGSNKRRVTLNVGGTPSSVFIDDEIQRLLNLLQQ